MKFTGILVSALAAVATAAPAEKRGSLDLGRFNNFQQFGNLDANYFLSVNSLDLLLFQQLAQSQNFNIGFFDSLFNNNNNNVLDIQNLLLIQQLLTFQSLANVGLFSNFDLAGLQLNNFNFGLLQNNIGGLGLGQFIQSSQIPQIQAVVTQTREFQPQLPIQRGKVKRNWLTT